MADCDEDAVQRDVADLVVGRGADLDAGHAAGVADDFIERMVPLDLDLAFLDLGHQAIDQDRFRTEFIATVDQGDFFRNVRQVQRFLDGRIAAANDGHFLFAIEETVAGRAGGNAFAHESLFGRQTQILGGSAGRDDQRVAGVFAHVADQPDRFFVQVRGVNMVEDDFGIEAFRMMQQSLHQFGTLHAQRIARPVFNIGGGHQLAALLDAGDHDRLKVGACCVDCGTVAGRAGTQDEDFGVFYGGHDEYFSKSGKKYGGSGKICCRSPVYVAAASKFNLSLNYWV